MKDEPLTIEALRNRLDQVEESIQNSISVTSACTNEWCESAEAVIDELTDAIYSLNVPRWADQEQSTRVKTLKKKAREVYAKYIQASEYPPRSLYGQAFCNDSKY
jgi:hypothetical protein